MCSFRHHVRLLLVPSLKTFEVDNQPDIYHLTLKLPKINFSRVKVDMGTKSEILGFIGNPQTLILIHYMPAKIERVTFLQAMDM